jgi:diphosphomevalonate decarboxylase
VKKSDVIQKIFNQQIPPTPVHEKGLAFAPTNIALSKYWGKRDQELNLPMTSSLSVSLPDKGAMTTMQVIDAATDYIVLNGDVLAQDSDFVRRTVQFLDLFRPKQNWRLSVEIAMDIPVAAGLASSACGFASLAAALNDLFDWKMPMRELSIIARLGSGSAARSLWPGFVEWHAGAATDGMDSYAEPLPLQWEELCLGIVPISTAPKRISSRAAMQQTVISSALYGCWPRKVAQDIVIIKQAIHAKNFALFAGTAESNALSMHATMLSSWPPICYFLPETISAMQKVWELRKQGWQLYFTQDAGPNLKLLFLERDKVSVMKEFPTVEVIKVFV